MFVWELLEMLIHWLPEVVGNSNRKFWLCWFTNTLSWAKAFLSDVRQSQVDFLHSWASWKYSHSTNVAASHDGTLKLKVLTSGWHALFKNAFTYLSSLLGQWCFSLTPNNTKTIERMTCHCFLRPIRRDLTNSFYITLLLGMHKNHARQNEGRRSFVLDKKAMAQDISS